MAEVDAPDASAMSDPDAQGTPKDADVLADPLTSRREACARERG